MTESKVEETLSKVTLLFTDPLGEGETIKIELKDKIPAGYMLNFVTVQLGGEQGGASFPCPVYGEKTLSRIERDMNIILDATIVNAKQRESIGKLVKRTIQESPCGVVL